MPETEFIAKLRGENVRLSVIVVNWNSRDDLALCLDSLARQSYGSLEVVVVDNGSHDGSAAMVRERFPNVTLCAESENLGFAEGCNRGIAASSGEWVALLNNDAVAEPDWAERLLEAIARAPSTCGMLQCTMYFLERGGTLNSLGLRLKRDGGAVDRAEGTTLTPSDDEELFCPTGGAGAYRRSMLDAVRLASGYLDREYFCYSEDFDLGWRAQLAGWSTRLAARSIVHHRWHGSTARRGRAWFVTQTRVNRLRTLLKNASLSFLLTTSPQTLYELGELLFHGGFKAFAKLPAAMLASFKARSRVSELATRSRRDVERRWAGLP